MCGGPRGFFELDLSVAQLEWKACFATDDMKVVPAKPLSPLHAFLKGSTPDATMGPIFGQTGSPMDLVTWQAEHGFSGVAEGPMRALKREISGQQEVKSPPELTDEPESDKLVLALVHHILKDVTHEQALKILLTRSCREDPIAASYVDDFSEEVVSDVILIGDSKERCVLSGGGIPARAPDKPHVTRQRRLVSDLVGSALASPVGRTCHYTWWCILGLVTVLPPFACSCGGIYFADPPPPCAEQNPHHPALTCPPPPGGPFWIPHTGVEAFLERAEVGDPPEAESEGERAEDCRPLLLGRPCLHPAEVEAEASRAPEAAEARRGAPASL